METLFTGRNIIFLSEVDSTNSYAIELLKNVKLSEGTAVHAASQIQGRGQRGNTWESEPSMNLTVSYVFSPTFLETKKQFLLYQISALAVYDVLSELTGKGQFDIKIKWPNDILINKKKVCGILIENILQHNFISNCVIGIGININQISLPDHATSLKKETGLDFDIKDCLNRLSVHLEKYYLSARSGNHSLIAEKYQSKLLNIGHKQEFEIDGQKVSKVIRGVNEEGCLVLGNDQEENVIYSVKELKWIL